jgi:YHS domain-containing protein
MTHSSKAMCAIVRLVTAFYHWRGIQSVNDPVCGMAVDPRRAKRSAEYQGQTYYFCAPACRKTFLADPEKGARVGLRALNCSAHRRRQT